MEALNIADRERYGAYQQGFMETFSRYSGKLLAVDETPVVKEGDWPYTRTVLIEFPLKPIPAEASSARPAAPGEAQAAGDRAALASAGRDLRPIELRINDIAQLFHTLDPFPFRERDLDKEVEEFIVGWARELVADQVIKIAIHFPDTETQTKAARELTEAFRRYFSERAGVTQRKLKELFRVGRHSLWVDLSILIVSHVSAHLAGGYLTETPLKRLVEDSFLSHSWVANWGPLEIFPYDWWPIVRRRDLYLTS